MCSGCGDAESMPEQELSSPYSGISAPIFVYGGAEKRRHYQTRSGRELPERKSSQSAVLPRIFPLAASEDCYKIYFRLEDSVYAWHGGARTAACDLFQSPSEILVTRHDIVEVYRTRGAETANASLTPAEAAADATRANEKRTSASSRSSIAANLWISLIALVTSAAAK